MRIEANRELSSAAIVRASTAPRKTPAESTQVDLGKADALHAAFEATPEVSAEQVAKAKALIQDPGYPSARVVDQMAEILAKHLRSSQ